MMALKTTFRTVAERLRTWREQHRAYAELSALDDHALADLGLSRADIPFVVFCKARQEAGEPALRIAANSNDARRAA
ncbi:MAG TPA: DUF1127 domain-containing protein [Stellaceae bacterium]|nr:DUF1127 domain-containing protein [Stellaceae bacterium]